MEFEFGDVVTRGDGETLFLVLGVATRTFCVEGLSGPEGADPNMYANAGRVILMSISTDDPDTYPLGFIDAFMPEQIAKED
jgi:hypothetical protein